ncbi:MAG TPA: tetratricopeptide repeat protein [Pyrinomonadaceae bacterium]|nr:tetratricopeptide repeat protein [Pyrinomonadaceae bacterium]
MTNEQDYKYDLFISYNRADEGWAKKLATRVEQEKWKDRTLVAFFAPWDIRPGESVDERLDRALAESRYVGLVLSQEAVNSQWVSEEWYSTHHANMKRRERRLIPLYLSTCEIPRFLDHLNRIDFREDEKFEEGIRLLLAVLRDEPLPRGAATEKHVIVSPLPSIPRAPVFGFVARRDAGGRDIVERLKEELAPGQDKLVTLSGPGGIGKSTLAAETARQLQDLYEDRIVWSSADGRADFTLLALLDDIATQLGRAELRTLAPGEKEEAVRALVAEPAALVVLDNYETIAAGEQKRIEAWFAKAQCCALFTSRPRVAGTVFVPVSAMSREEAAEFLEKLVAQTQDAQIFSAVVRGRVFETAEANPFVMQWVVAQIDDAQEPDAVLEELAQGGDAAERVFDRSYNLLDDDGRDVLLALSLFAPSATRNALAEVAGFDNTDRAKEAAKSLNRLWLVKAIDEHRRLAVEGLTRTLAAARLSRDTRADEFRSRFVAYFLRYAIVRKGLTPEDYDALEEEKDNLLRASEAAFAAEDWGSVMRMAYALANPDTNATGMLIMRGYWDEAVRLGEQALQAARSSQNERWLSGLLHNLAAMYQYRGELAEARRLYDESLEINKRLGNQSGVALTIWSLGNIALNQGNVDEAKRLLTESLDTFTNLKEQANAAGVLHQLATLAHNQGEFVEARRLYSESLEISKRLGNQSGVASTLHNLGRLAHGQGDVQEARRLYSEGLEIDKRLGNQDGIAISLYTFGLLAEKDGDKAEAARLFREALNIFERLGSPSAEIARRRLARVEGESS